MQACVRRLFLVLIANIKDNKVQGAGAYLRLGLYWKRAGQEVWGQNLIPISRALYHCFDTAEYIFLKLFIKVLLEVIAKTDSGMLLKTLGT